MPGPVELGYLAGAAGHHPETLISGQRLDGRKASVFARLEECEPRPGMQLITRRADALRETRARRAAVVLAEAGGGLEQLGMVVPSGAGPGGGDAIVTRLTKVTRGAAHGSGGQAGQAAGLGDADLDQARVGARGWSLHWQAACRCRARPRAGRRCWRRTGRRWPSRGGQRRRPAVPGRT